MPRTFSGKLIVKILCRSFGFSFVSQRGSHVKLQRTFGGRKITTVVPLHKELARGTFRGIIELAGVDEKTFLDQT